MVITLEMEFQENYPYPTLIPAQIPSPKCPTLRFLGNAFHAIPSHCGWAGAWRWYSDRQPPIPTSLLGHAPRWLWGWGWQLVGLSPPRSKGSEAR